MWGFCGNQYKVDGSGTTVVVWPIFNSDLAAIHDSAFTSIIVVMPNSIDEYNQFESEILKIKNPISQNIELKCDTTIYRKVYLLDVTGRMVQIVQNNVLNIALLSKGLFYLNFYNSENGKVLTKKNLIE